MDIGNNKDDAIAFVRQMQKKTLSGFLLTAVLCLFLAALMVVAAFTSPSFAESSLAGKIIGGVFLALLLVLAALILRLYFRRAGKNGPLLKALMDGDTSAIRQAELVTVRAARGRAAWVGIYRMADGASESLNFEQNQKQLVLDLLAAYFPSANIIDKTVGA
jgi:uncharacterized membrane protein (DUF485 family)